MITRFAPSPTGPLHLGHAYSALFIQDQTVTAHGQYLLRIEDTDSMRARPAWETAIYDDLDWLGISWCNDVRRQSDHYADYSATLDRLEPYLYPCNCTRRAIKEAGANLGADGLVYPGTCRHRHMSNATSDDAIRLNLFKALQDIPGITYQDTTVSKTLHPDFILTQIGDPVLRRKDTGDPAYHLACVVDDGIQNITHVFRGADLINATPLHVILQSLLGLPTPIYHHHALIRDDDGKRLAKINTSRAISKYREDGATPDDIRTMVGL